MKKLVYFMAILFSCGMLAFSKPISVKAEEIVEEPTITETEGEQTFEEFKEEITAWLQNFMDTSLVAKIISWAVDAGVLTSLFAVTLKYRKYKNTTTGDLIKKFKSEIKEYLENNFKQLSASEIKSITTKMCDLENSIETIMKVLVLMQDTSSKGRATLIDFLGSKTESKEVSSAVVEVKEEIKKQEEESKEIKEKVSGEYTNIF